MSNAPSSLSPRQRMINMMYLVLTALLALNVSKEVLRSFWEQNVTGQNSNEIIRENTDNIYADFKKDSTENPVKYGSYYTDAKLINILDNNLFTLTIIQSINLRTIILQVIFLMTRSNHTLYLVIYLRNVMLPINMSLM